MPCGFRTFVPLLVLNLAALSGQIQLSPEFSWIGSHAATVAFATATIVGVLGYYIPWMDHLMDTVATPVAIVAGVIASVSTMLDMSPFFKWTLALIAGGGMAGLVQGTTVTVRAKTAFATAGAGNSVIATLELLGAAATALLSVFVPLLSAILIGLVCFVVLRRVGPFPRGRRKTL